jgi:putative restriction endonuclease
MPSWETLITGVRVWTRGTKRAVHKPLLVLMILGRARRGGSNVFRFEEVDEPLREALRAFGGSPKSEYPFWYLKDDGFWVVRDEARLATLKRGSEPSRKLLLEEDATAEVPLALWEDLAGDQARVARLVQTVVEANWPAEMRAAVVAQVVV